VSGGWVFETTPKPHRVSGVVLNVWKECNSILIYNHGSPLFKKGKYPSRKMLVFLYENWQSLNEGFEVIGTRGSSILIFGQKTGTSG